MTVCCTSGLHRHAPLRPCEGCRAPCSRSESLHTRGAGMVGVCPSCWPAEKARRIRAVERVEGVVPLHAA